MPGSGLTASRQTQVGERQISGKIVGESPAWSTFGAGVEREIFLTLDVGEVTRRRLSSQVGESGNDVWAVRSDRCGQFVEGCRDT
jgi:hypothetical protein